MKLTESDFFEKRNQAMSAVTNLYNTPSLTTKSVNEVISIVEYITYIESMIMEEASSLEAASIKDD